MANLPVKWFDNRFHGIPLLSGTPGAFTDLMDAVLVNGFGYFKNSVFIDYPPKEPTSKRVVLYSIIDGKALQQVWSDPLTGQYEFKFIALRKPYLIFTYDSDEDYNAVIMGPVYPTLMPQFEGIVKP